MRSPLRTISAVLLIAWSLFIAYLALGSRLQPGAPSLIEYSLSNYATLWGSLSWNWGVGIDTWIPLLIGAVGLGVMTFVGRLLVNCFEVYIPRFAALPLWFVMGVSACGTVNTFLALPGLLYQWTALLTLVILVAALWYAGHRAEATRIRRFTPRPDIFQGDPWMIRRAQRQGALEEESRSWLRPQGFVEANLQSIFYVLLTLITLLTFYHACFFPETYWDSLILYLGYARGIFLQHAFPLKVTGQVGVGLGANYPHLFEITGAGIATWFNSWSPLYLQLATPIAGLFTILLTYHIVLRMTRSVLIALIAALLVRAAPYIITYHTWSSNYSFVTLWGAAFFYLALRYLEEPRPGYFILATLTAAFAINLNYLMGSIWIVWLVFIFAAHGFGCWRLARKPWFWALGFASGIIASHWYIRNWIVTGNPVYAFFTNVFKGTKNVNPEVMQSAIQEWQAHGDGIGIYGPTLSDRLLGTFPFFATNGSTCYKWAPVFLALVVPGVLAFVIAWIMIPFEKREIAACEKEDLGKDLDLIPLEKPPVEPGSSWPIERFGLVALSYMVILFAYHYLLGPFYLYHLLGCVSVFGVFIAFALRNCPRKALWFFAAFALFAGLMPGIPWALLGGKTSDPIAYHNPGMSTKLFYQLKYGQEPKMWEFINKNCLKIAILTHENRHLLFDPSITLVHFDDWEVQQVWGKSKEERLACLRGLGVKYYLAIPFEKDHPINARLGHAEWLQDGTLEKIYQVKNKDGADVTLYRFKE